MYGNAKWSSGDQLVGNWVNGLQDSLLKGGLKLVLEQMHQVALLTRQPNLEGNLMTVGTIPAAAAKDFKEASDYFTSRKTTTSGNITDNNASSRVDQFAASLSSAKKQLRPVYNQPDTQP